jgi:hypothetical protein
MISYIVGQLNEGCEDSVFLQKIGLCYDQPRSENEFIFTYYLVKSPVTQVVSCTWRPINRTFLIFDFSPIGIAHPSCCFAFGL